MALPTESNGNLPARKAERAASTSSSCPHCGLFDDPETRLGYPDPANHCHYADPVAPVAIEHQERCCLQPDYTGCPMLARPAGAPLPDQIHAEPATLNRRDHSFALAAGLMLLLLLAVGGFAMTREGNGAAAEGPAAVAASATPSPAPTTDPATATSLVAVPAETTTPTATSQPPTVTMATTATAGATATASATATATVSSSATPSPTSPPATPTPRPPRAIVALGRVNLRWAPTSAVDNVIGTAAQGTSLTIVGRTEFATWWQVCCTEEGEEAWVFYETVTVEGDLGTIPITAYLQISAPATQEP